MSNSKSNAVKHSLESAESVVRADSNMRWEGWDIIQHRPTSRLKPTSKEIRFNRDTGKWGFERVIRPTSKGMYWI